MKVTIVTVQASHPIDFCATEHADCHQLLPLLMQGGQSGTATGCGTGDPQGKGPLTPTGAMSEPASSPSSLMQMITGMGDLVQERLAQILRLLGELQPDTHRLTTAKNVTAKPSAGPARLYRNKREPIQQVLPRSNGATGFHSGNNLLP